MRTPGLSPVRHKQKTWGRKNIQNKNKRKQEKKRDIIKNRYNYRNKSKKYPIITDYQRKYAK